MTTATANARNRTSPKGDARRYATRGTAALAPQPLPQQVAVPETPVPAKERLRAAPPAPVSAPKAPFVALVLTVVVAGVLGILVLNTKINENAFRLSHLQAQQVTLDQQEQQLNQLLADRESPNTLAAEALKLGLVPAGTPAFIRLPDGRVLGVPQPATSAPSITSQAGNPSPQAGNAAPAAGH
jgi:hypothetical protein